jgi:nucleoid-associated protein YgaU
MWFKKKERFADIGKTKKSTSSIIDNAVSRQNGWMTRRSAWANRMLRRMNIFARPKSRQSSVVKHQTKKCCVIRDYWFPILCARAVIAMLIYVFVVPRCVATSIVPEPIIQPVATEMTTPKAVEIPTFDMVRIGKDGKIVVAGRWLPRHGVSIKINGKMVATEQTDYSGEFVYAPTSALPAGNYTIRLSGVEQTIDSNADVFVYISERGDTSSMSLLMDKDGSRFLQKPQGANGEFAVSKIDYLANGRLVVQGVGLPRTRVTMTLSGHKVGMTRVSDHKNFGIGADVGALEPGREYTLHVRMHDGVGRRAMSIRHKFVMPQIQPADDTWYSVRRGDSLWVIARNFLGRGIRYTLIVEKNNIENPDLIYPKQKLQIPVKNGKRK